MTIRPAPPWPRTTTNSGTAVRGLSAVCSRNCRVSCCSCRLLQFIFVVAVDDDDGTCEVLHTQQAMNWDTIVLSTIPLPASRRRECINDVALISGRVIPSIPLLIRFGVG